MRIFLAGGISGNLREFWQKVMKVYCASPNSRKEVIEAMNSFLAGDKDKIMRESIYGADFFVGDGDSTLSGINVLESYYYLRKNEDFMPLVRHFGSFLLDSGAYTFMAGSHKGGCDWDAYVSEYADFINRFDVKLFFELDIDSVVGLAEVERLRHKLERMTGKKPIPVWHKNRGKEYFVKMCEEYPYVAIGGIVTKEIPAKSMRRRFRGSSTPPTSTRRRFTGWDTPPSPTCKSIGSIRSIAPHGSTAIAAATSASSTRAPD